MTRFTNWRNRSKTSGSGGGVGGCSFGSIASLRQCFVGEALADHAPRDLHEPLPIVADALIETERLLVDIPEQMERLDADVRPVDGPLQQAPEVLQAVGVDLAPDVGLGMVDGLMEVVRLQSFVGLQRISVDARTRLDMLANLGLQRAPASVLHDQVDLEP